MIEQIVDGKKYVVEACHIVFTDCRRYDAVYGKCSFVTIGDKKFINVSGEKGNVSVDLEYLKYVIESKDEPKFVPQECDGSRISDGKQNILIL